MAKWCHVVGCWESDVDEVVEGIDKETLFAAEMTMHQSYKTSFYSERAQPVERAARSCAAK